MATTSPSQDTVKSVARKELMRSLTQVAGMLPVLIVICILFAFLTESFLTTNNLINVVRQASINIVLAAGMTFVILTGGIDLAVGSVLGMTAVLSLLFSLNPSLSWAADSDRTSKWNDRGRDDRCHRSLFWAASVYCHPGNVYGLARVPHICLPVARRSLITIFPSPGSAMAISALFPGSS